MQNKTPARVDTFIAPPCSQEIEVLLEDEQFLLINKPSGLLSLSGKNPLNRDSVHYRLVQQWPDASLVHRLDFGTSGIMLLALNKTANANIMRQFQARTVAKTYIALLYGHLDNDEGVIDAPIAKDSQNFPLVKVCHDTGKQAQSQYKVVEYLQNPPTTRVQFTPLTGRTHQLRIHSHEIGHPILGCDLYGSEKTHSMADRLMLHANSLEFDHPVSGERIVAQANCPF